MFDFVTKIRLVNLITKSSAGVVLMMVAGINVLEKISADRWKALCELCGDKLNFKHKKYLHPSAYVKRHSDRNCYWANKWKIQSNCFCRTNLFPQTHWHSTLANNSNRQR
jgi:hypothetical protein